MHWWNTFKRFNRHTALLTRLLTTTCLCLGSFGYTVPIKPPCTKPIGFDNERQIAFLHNFFASHLMLTPLGPPKQLLSNAFGVEVGYMRPLSCEERLVEVAGHLKAEHTNWTPIFPRFRLLFRLFDVGPLSIAFGATFVPPIPFPFGQMAHVGGETIVSLPLFFGLDIGLRGHFTMARVRADMAGKLDTTSQDLEDLFFANVFGGDVGASYRFNLGFVSLVPYLWAGVTALHTLFVVGDDLAVSQKRDSNPAQATVAGGLYTSWVGDHLSFTLEASAVMPVQTTFKALVGYEW